MSHLYQIESDQQRMYDAGWAGPYVATMSPSTKAEIDEQARMVRQDVAIERPAITITKLSTRWGDVTFAINPNLGPEIVLGATVRTAPDQEKGPAQ